MPESTIRRVSWLTGLSVAGRRELAVRGVTRQFPEGHVLWNRRDEPRGLFIVLEGKVRVVRGSRGRQYVLHREGPGGTLGEVPLFAGGTYPGSAITEEPTQCLVLSRAALEAAIAADPQLATLLLARLSSRVRELARRLERITIEPVAQRLARYLLRRRDEAGEVFTLGQSQGGAAEDLGTVREVLVKELRNLCTGGVLRRVGKARYRAVNLPALLSIARQE